MTLHTDHGPAVRLAIDATLRALHAVGDASLDAAATVLAVQGRRLLECDCLVCVVDPGRPDTLGVVAGAGPWAERLVGRAYPLEGTLHGRALRARAPVVTHQAEAESPEASLLAGGGVAEGVLVALPVGVPVPDGRPGLGVVSFWRPAGTPFDEAEVATAAEFTAVTGGALSRGELLRAHRAAAERLSGEVRDLEGSQARRRQAHERARQALLAVSQHADAGGSLAEFFGEMSATVARLVDAERTGFARLTPQGRLRPLRRAHGVDDADLAAIGQPRVRPDGTRGLERVLNEGVTIRLRVEDLPPDGAVAPQALHRLARRDLLITRWSAGNRVLGILAAYDCRRPGGFTEEDAQVLEICALATGLVWERVALRRRARSAEARRVAQMEEHVRQMRSIVGSAMEAIVSMDEQGRVLDLNRAAEELFGYARSAAVGRPLSDLMVAGESRRQHRDGLRRQVDAGDSAMLIRRFEGRARRADGGTFDADVAVVRTTWEGRPVFTGFVRDISQARRAAERERQQAARVAALEQAKTQLLNLASHELRGPLGILNGYLAMVEEGALGDVPAELAGVIPMLRNKVTEMNLLVDGMLEAARLDDDSLRLSTAPLDLRDVVGRAVRQVAGMQRDRDRVGLTLPTAPATVLGDEVRLLQVVGNLVHNALKYSPGGEPVEVSLATGAGAATVRVVDHGIGIDEADMPRLFTRFGRIVNRHNSHIPGTGLGLHLARELARLHGGDITVTSSPGRGSEFVLTLPLLEG